MKKILLISLMVMVSLMVACNDDSGEESNTNPETSGEGTPSNNDSQDNDADENDQYSTEDEPSVDSDDVAEEPSNDDQAPTVAADSASILEKTLKTMTEMDSFRAKVVYYDNTTINGVNSETETTATMDIIYAGGTTMHANYDTVSDGETEKTEMYMTGDNMYVFSEGAWYNMPLNSGSTHMYDQFRVIQDQQIAQFLEHSQNFKVGEKAGTYVISFIGDMEQYKSLVLGGSLEVLGESFAEHVKNLQVENGKYEIIIEKGTFRVIGTNISYETTSMGELGDYYQYYDSSYELSQFNDIGEITVPDEVKEQAMQFGQ
jgi:hypothetical protein